MRLFKRLLTAHQVLLKAHLLFLLALLHGLLVALLELLLRPVAGCSQHIVLMTAQTARLAVGLRAAEARLAPRAQHQRAPS